MAYAISSPLTKPKNSSSRVNAMVRERYSIGTAIKFNVIDRIVVGNLIGNFFIGKGVVS